jgi:hypothetical protein
MVNFIEEGMYFNKRSGSSHGADGTYTVHEPQSENLSVCSTLKKFRHNQNHANSSYKFTILVQITYPNPPGPLLIRLPNNISCLNCAARSAIDFGALMNLSSGITPNSVAPQVLSGI